MVETWLGEKEEIDIVKHYSWISFPQAAHVQKVARGGIGVLVKQGQQWKWKIWRTHPTHIWLQLDHAELSQYFGFVYLPPRGSSALQSQEDDVLGPLLEDISSIPFNGEICLMGDFNARIGEWQNTNDEEEQILDIIESPLEDLKNTRQSEDKKVDSRGRALQKLCQETN